MQKIEIDRNHKIDPAEIEWQFSRSSGPGGQNVNKLNTRVTLFFDLRNSAAFGDSEKKRIFKKLSTRTDKHGRVRVSSQKHRSQHANREAAIEKLIVLLQKALKRQKKRKPTKTPYSAIRKRLQDKKHHSKIKRLRSKPPENE